MHEYRVTKQIIQTVEKYAKEKGGKIITKINLVVGDYSGCVADSIALYFDIIAENTMCEKAVLNINKVKPMLKCNVCNEYFERKPFEFSCPKENCNGEGEPTEIGREFYIKSIEIES